MKINQSSFIKIAVIALFTFIVLCILSPISLATEETSQEQILQSQTKSLDIGGFIAEAKHYTDNSLDGIDLNNLFTSAMTGNIDNKLLLKAISKMIGKEVIDSINVLGSIVVIIVIHSILKSISEGLENKSISQLTYYVQYILIVTLIMVNFGDILNMVRTTIGNLVGFSNSLIPLLMTLILTTGNIASANLLQPVILFIITFIGNFINTVLIPFVLIANVLGIISKVSNRVQVDKLGKFFHSSVGWILGIVLTIFVGVVSVEGSLSSTVDGITAKTTKAAVSSFIPVVGKILGDAVDAVIGCSNILKNAVGIVRSSCNCGHLHRTGDKTCYLDGIVLFGRSTLQTHCRRKNSKTLRANGGHIQNAISYHV